MTDDAALDHIATVIRSGADRCRRQVMSLVEADEYATAAERALAEVRRLRHENRILSIDPEDYFSGSWSGACREGHWQHEFCDDPECECPCHGDAA